MKNILALCLVWIHLTFGQSMEEQMIKQMLCLGEVDLQSLPTSLGLTLPPDDITRQPA